MANERDENQSKSAAAAAAKQSGTQPPRGDVKESRGGPQTDQLTGETDKGAHNQEMKNRNPQGNKSER